MRIRQDILEREFNTDSITNIEYHEGDDPKHDSYTSIELENPGCELSFKVQFYLTYTQILFKHKGKSIWTILDIVDGPPIEPKLIDHCQVETPSSALLYGQARDWQRAYVKSVANQIRSLWRMLKIASTPGTVIV